ncbi:MAG TPA: hypothetical protein VMS17_16655 [Gemmataceae bacterium]|nr:hypothetical protein [Gemmataceae bacterium]
MKRSLSLFAAALALTLAAAAQSRADQMFWYNWTRNPFSIAFVQQNNQSLPGTGGVNLIDLNSKAVEADATLGTGNPAADIQVISTADSSNPDVIKTGGGQYTLTLQMWLVNPATNPSAPSATVSFAGQLYSTGGTTALAANLGNKILSSTDAGGTHLGQTFATATVGGVKFVVSYSGFAEPGNSNDQTFGAISFHINATTATIGGGSSPEPSGMVLGCLGLTVLGGVLWRARRRRLIALKAMA